MRVLITGGAGFIGSAVAERLSRDGAWVRVFDSLHPQIHGADPAQASWTLHRAERFADEVVQADVTDRDALLAGLAGVDAVVHFAAETGTGQSMYEIDRYTQTNIGGTGLLLDVLRKEPHAVRRVVVASSRSIYGEGKYWAEGIGAYFPSSRLLSDLQAGRFDIQHPAGRGRVKCVATTEDSPAKPISVYAVTKYSQEQLVKVACAAVGISAIALRFQNVYGAGQSLSNPYTGILSIFSNQILNGEKINIFEDGEESRDFVNVEDAAHATALALGVSHDAAGVFNIGSGVGTSVKQVVGALQRAHGREVEIEVTGQFRLGDIRHNIADLTKARESLGFEPTVTFDEGIREFASWAEAQPRVSSEGYVVSMAELAEHKLLS